MKESKFIELLNLYIDQQISPAEAATLEQEILQDARRRRIYRQYCQMHRACTVVFENFRSPADPAVVEVRPRRFGWGYYAAGLAAAACVGFVAVQAFLQPAPPSAPRAIAARPAAVSTGVTVAAAVPVRRNVPRVRSGQATEAFVAQRLAVFSSTGRQDPVSLVIVSDRDSLRPLASAEAVAPNLRPSIEQFVFEQSAPANDNLPVLRIRPTTDAQAEMAAYQFQR